MKEVEVTKTVVVAGDVTVDWNIARIRKTDSVRLTGNPDDFTGACCQYGGAAMLAELISALAKETGDVELRKINLPDEKITPYDIRFPHSYALWAPFKMDEHSEKKVWRVEEFLGLNPAHREEIPESKESKWNTVSDDFSNPDLLILNDANLGFREHPEYWPQGLSNKQAHPWILVNTARPVAQGKLWDNLLGDHCSRIVAVMTANDLRGEQIKISRQLSWESTARDAVWELTYNPSINRLAQCAYIIVSFGIAGVLMFGKNARDVHEATLFFDTNALGGEWGRQYRGSMIGYNSCLIAAIARELLLNLKQPVIARGIQKGIRAMRWLQIEGYGPVDNGAEYVQLAFPAEQIVQELFKDKADVASVMIKEPTRKEEAGQKAAEPDIQNPIWTILQEKHPGLLETLAEDIVLNGVELALPDVPISKFGDLKTVDRREIESLQSISSLIREYIEVYRKKPLSIAVFGPPGAGKSFSLQQVAKSIAPDDIVPMSFNLSQFSNPEDLYDAMHQVRDKVLSGKIPLVFWDEFDTSFEENELGWLRYFLAPMQDGEFQDAQMTHTIGRSIFVFAGGTAQSIEKLGSKLGDDKKSNAKLSDFVSRLRGFLNILGPDPLKNDNDKTPISDPYFIIRRAILLRSIIGKSAPHLLHNGGTGKIVAINPGVLRAFLNIRRYKHGARSIEAILEMSQLSGKASFERSILPSETQLDLHVNGREFTALVNQLELNDSNIEIMAKAFHDNYCDYYRAQGYVWGPENSEEKKTQSSLIDYDKLPDNEKKQNGNSARYLFNRLGIVGYIIVTNRNNQPLVEFQQGEIEILAEMEHRRWMKQKFEEGWKYEKTTNNALKLHADLLPWEQLTNASKENDRVVIRDIPKTVASAGYNLFKLT
jgi:hypothetical protein